MKLFFLIAPLILARKYGGRDAGPQTPDGEPRQKCDHTTRRLNGLIAATSCQKVCESKTDMKKCGLCSTLLQNSLMTGETHWPCYWKRLCELVCPKFVAAPDADAEFCQKLCKDDWHSVTLGNILSLSISYNTYAFPNKQHVLTNPINLRHIRQCRMANLAYVVHIVDLVKLDNIIPIVIVSRFNRVENVKLIRFGIVMLFAFGFFYLIKY